MVWTVKFAPAQGNDQVIVALDKLLYTKIPLDQTCVYDIHIMPSLNKKSAKSEIY